MNYTPGGEELYDAYRFFSDDDMTREAQDRRSEEAHRGIAKIKADAVAEALRELLDDATSVKDEYGHVERFVPEWAVRDEIDRIEMDER